MIRAVLLWSAVGVAVGSAALGLVPNEPSGLTGKARIVDGDSIAINQHRIRLFGIDAPELEQVCAFPSGTPWSCGVEARDALRHFVGTDPVTCEREDTDRYGRIVATCWARGADLGKMMVTQGMAVAYRRYSFRYVKDEAQARGEGRGIWTSTFDRPEDWRRNHQRGMR